jgi:hypothetical protein
MEFASYQQAKIAINKFDGAMTKGQSSRHSPTISVLICVGQTISIRLLAPVVQRGPPSQGRGGGAAPGGNLLARISGGAPGPAANNNNAPRGAMRGGRGGPRGA